MCGIAGFIGKGDEAVLRAMTETLAHRGPDGSGIYSSGGVFLGHRRLSVIDLEGGSQPMTSADGLTTLVFNGEIYNFRELKKELSSRYEFRTRSDTEVILHGYEAWGEEVFQMLEGMFAVAIWDARRKALILARDPFGEKPLYYARQNGLFAFASELRAFLKHPHFQKSIDERSLVRFLYYGQVPSPFSIYNDVKKLRPGELLIFQDGDIKTRHYFIPQLRGADPAPSFAEAEREVERRLKAAVGKMLVADVPLGVFLSGGIDSSLIAYFAKQLKPDLETFSIGFRERSFDESPYARVVAGHLGTKHHEQILDGGAILEFLPRVADIADEPFADSSIVPTFLLSKFAREHVTVALGGDGGDEAFMGYPTFIVEKFWPILKPLLTVGAPIAGGLLRALPHSGGYMSLDFKFKKILAGRGLSGISRHANWLANIDHDLLTELTGGGVKNIIAADLADFAERFSASAESDRLKAFYLKYYLCDQVLTKVDRASMAVGLETRAPFLDKAVMEYALQLPDDYKLRGITTKYILRHLAKKYLPPEIVRRPKQGFAVPLSNLFRGELKEFAREKIFSLRGFSVLDGKIIERLWDEHQRGVIDRRTELWNLIVLSMWRERWNAC